MYKNNINYFCDLLIFCLLEIIPRKAVVKKHPAEKSDHTVLYGGYFSLFMDKSYELNYHTMNTI